MSTSEASAADRTEAFVHILLLVVDAQRANELLDDVRGTISAALSRIDGFMSVTVLVSDDRSRIVVLSEWKRRGDWAQAEWDERIQEAMVTLYRSADHVDTHAYEEALHYPPR